MTNPTPTGLNAKAIVALIGSLLSVVGPWILSASAALPPPWPGVIGVIFAILTAAGVYRAPYLPKNTTIAPAPTSGSTPWPKS